MLEGALSNGGEQLAASSRTVRLQPRHPQAWLNLAHAQRKAGRETEARQAILEHQKVRVQAAR